MICLFFLAGCGEVGDTSPPADYIPYNILWAGDTLLADAAQPYLDEYGYQWPFEYLSGLLQADYAILNGEGPVTGLTEPWDPDQTWSYNADPQAAAALAALGFDAVGLSNNHALDRGPEGLMDTWTHLGEVGLVPFGAGRDVSQAESSLLIYTPYGVVGVVGLSLDWGAARTAEVGQAGTIPLSENSIQRGYDLARKAGADWVVAFVHWGRNYAEVDSEQRAWAKAFSRAGYALVIGTGAHVVQPIEVIKGMPVVYSLGNFVFGTPGRFTEEFPGFGLLVVSPLGPDGFELLQIRCIQTDNDLVEFQPRPCTAEQTGEVLGELNTDIEVVGGVGVLDW
jgi:poly-gamma-glutamate capsule biosynthesis protein CapA/YwtB (metallophosphatase superfamily)